MLGSGQGKDGVGRFPLFDSLRAIAAIMVLSQHALGWAGAMRPGTALGRYALQLNLGVAIFFVISGFLLYRPFVRAHANAGESPGTGAYAWRRFLRIAPAYWVALTVTAVWLGTSHVFRGGTASYYAFTQVYSAATLHGGLSQTWSLCVEVAFYAFLPLYALVVRSGARRAGGSWLARELGWLAVIVLGGFGYELAIALDGGGVHTAATAVRLAALPTFLPMFGAGMALAIASVALEGRTLPRPLAWVDRRPELSWVAAAATFVVVAHVLTSRTTFGAAVQQQATTTQALLRTGLSGLFGAFVVLPAVFGHQARGVLRRMLAMRALLFLGSISYGIFLWHQTVAQQLARWSLDGNALGHPYITWVVTVFVGTFGLACASWYLIERPALSLKSWVPARGRRAAEAQEAAATVAP